MMTMMKNPMILVACTLLFASLVVLSSQSSFGPSECCFRYRNAVLPKKSVVYYKYTDVLCPMEGVLFTMKNGGEICADPSKEWVKNIIEAKKRANNKKVNNPSGTESSVN
ncbi:C-C motif chemokine 4-like Lymphocyte activation gene 1 protein [Channa argus]|uniref:C-C motif chemokine n=1 Tax=Channa argus TaxID=215402 RepID=A0A6G1QJT5_CHAAH|nr:C-C motif chemokine 4-like Lymphocyte activation gene 1 protein [Channa argus]KAK2890285.1 hypothetical protein Q8A73_018585 [Channa argus]